MTDYELRWTCGDVLLTPNKRRCFLGSAFRLLRLRSSSPPVARYRRTPVENVRNPSNRQRENQQDREFGHGRGEKCDRHHVQGRPVHDDRRHHRVGVDILIYSVLLRVYAIVDVHTSYSHAIQVSKLSRSIYTIYASIFVGFA